MRRTLLVTNDFPPRPGGIQSYLESFVNHLPVSEIVVYAPRWRDDSHRKFDAAQPYEVIRHSTTLMLPTPAVTKRAQEIAATHGCEAVWFGAAAPLALMAPALRRSGMSRVIASTHGHEVGWSMLPLARQALTRIGETSDVITFVSKYTRGRFSSAFGATAALEHLPSGVDTTIFHPDQAARETLRAKYKLEDRAVILCLSRLVPRKGQDMLIKALKQIRATIDDATLVIVGGGPYAGRLQALAVECGVERHVIFTGSVPAEELAAHHTIADVFAMPCRTRGGGLDVEGLGIVYLEASATGVPVVAGKSGGAPETVIDNVTGRIVDGESVDEIARTLTEILSDRDRAADMGRVGRDWVAKNWRWDILGARLEQLLS
ncbi:MAG: glycosyltransferase family 4 protein [Mycobacteriaceae bacterium]